MDEHVAATLKLDRGAVDRLVAWLGDDPQRLVGVLGTLVGSFGPGARRKAPTTSSRSWASRGRAAVRLTDALDKGDIADALGKLHRMTGGEGRHALQVMATLHGHYGRIWPSTAPRSPARRTLPSCWA